MGAREFFILSKWYATIGSSVFVGHAHSKFKATLSLLCFCLFLLLGKEEVGDTRKKRRRLLPIGYSYQ